MDPVLGGSHLEFSQEEMDSDGSDYTPSTEEEDTSIDSENYDMEIDTFSMSRIQRKCNIVFDPPELPDWREMSLGTLKELIQQHRETGTVRKFLCEIDTESDYYEGDYFELNRGDIPPTQGLAANEKVTVNRYLKEKIYRTMLNFACCDRDGERGQAKTKLILQTARRYQINMRIYMATYGEMRFTRNSRRHDWREHTGWRDATTPLHSLIFNQNATPESLRMICSAWPRVVHIRGNEDDRTKTILMHLVYSCSDENEIERLQAFSDVLFEAAEKTKEGARALVLASDKINEGVNNYFEAHDENDEEQTVLHVATTYFERPEGTLPIFLKWWPEALKHIGESSENRGDHPFFNIFRCCETYESLVKSIEAFLQYSSLDALAAGLLYENIRDGYGFDLFIQALESSEVGMPTRHWPLEADDASTWQSCLVNSFDRYLLQRRDADGRSILHYIAAYDDVIDHDLQGQRCRYDIERKVRKEYEVAGREYPYPRGSWDNDREDDEGASLAIFMWRKRREKQILAKVGEIAEWFLKRDKTLALTVDNNGLNPFQYAVSMGKKWNNGLDVVARLVPGWAHPGDGSLCPFAIAAHSCDDLDTVFELLRFDASVLA